MKSLIVALSLIVFPLARAEQAAEVPPFILGTELAYKITMKVGSDAEWSGFLREQEGFFATWSNDTGSNDRGAFLNRKLLGKGLAALGAKPEKLKDFMQWLALYREWKQENAHTEIAKASQKFQTPIQEVNTLVDSLDWTPPNKAESEAKVWARIAVLIEAHRKKKQ